MCENFHADPWRSSLKKFVVAWNPSERQRLWIVIKTNWCFIFDFNFRQRLWILSTSWPRYYNFNFSKNISALNFRHPIKRVSVHIKNVITRPCLSISSYTWIRSSNNIATQLTRTYVNFICIPQSISARYSFYISPGFSWQSPINHAMLRPLSGWHAPFNRTLATVSRSPCNKYKKARAAYIALYVYI